MLVDFKHILERERFEVQPVARVVVGRYCLRVAVDHDRLVTVFAQRKRSVAAAIIELDSLPDAIRPTAKDDDFLLLRRSGFILFFVAAIEIRCEALKLSCACIDELVNGLDAKLLTQRPNSISPFGTRQAP